MDLKTTDRYVTFKGIEGDDNAKRVVALLLQHIDDPAKGNAFWDKFKEKLASISKPDPNIARRLDELFLVHSYINNIRELFEEYEDHAALALLQQVEEESC
jgi:N(2)-fixation sustaining protein CowN